MSGFVLFLSMTLVGVGVGLLSNILGLGGGILMIPAFMALVSGMDIYTAKGTSLFVVVFIASINAWRLTRNLPQKPWYVAGILSVGAVAGGFFGAWITTWLPEAVVFGLFLALVFVLAVRTFFIKDRIVDEQEAQHRWILLISLGVFSGIVGGSTGTGGGIVLVPLALMAGISSNDRVVGLSNMVMVPTSIAGSIAHLMASPVFTGPGTVGHVNLLLAPVVFIGAQLVSPLGRFVNARLSLRRRRMLLGLLLLAVAFHMLYTALFG